MNKIVAIVLLLSGSLALSAQGTPDWVDEDFRRMKFPENVYFTGFAYGEVSAGKSLQEVTQEMITNAQADLSRKIRVQITSRTQSETSAVSAGGQYSERESFTNRSATESSAEVVGIKTESYYNTKTRIVHAFANVNRYELIGYHKGNLSMNLSQAEGLMQTAQSLETAGEKSKARQQCEIAKPLIAKVRASQEMLVTIDVNITPADLQQAQTEALHNQITQMQARLAQAVLVYVESTEDLFGTKVDIVANKVKAELAKNGCSFTDDVEQADFHLRIRVTSRASDNQGGIVFCYADAAIELYDNHKKKAVYGDEIAQKGGSSSQDKAGHKAMSDIASKIAEKLKNWIQ